MRGAIVLLAGLALAAPATAAPPLVTATAAPATGVAPLPMWIAPSLFSDHGFGTTVVVRL